MRFNLQGATALYLRETKRFLKVYNQTIIGPVVNSLIFGLVLHVIYAKSDTNKSTMLIGLTAGTMIQACFANSCSSIIASKIIGYKNDLIALPLKPNEIIIAHTLSAATRSMIVFLIMAIVISCLHKIQLFHIGMFFFLCISFSLIFGMLGFLTGALSRSFEQTSSVTNYVIVPGSLLSGTFFSVKEFPCYIQKIIYANPFFYLIDGFKYCFSNNHNSNLSLGITFITFINILIYLLSYLTLKKGWGLKD